MPLTDPSKSFEVSVRHLFRHLGEPSALRRNPLVQLRFQNRTEPVSDRFCCAELRERVLEAARECLAEDTAAGRHRQGERAYKVVFDLCNSVNRVKTACELNLSSRQYYRERRTITHRVARKLVTTFGRASFRAYAIDTLQLLIARAASLIEEGCAGASIAMLERALPGIAEPQGKVLALLKMSSAYVQHGNVHLAESSLREATDIQSRENAASDSTELLDLLSLTSIEVALANGSDQNVPEMLESIISRAKRDHSAVHAQRAHTLLEALLEKCSFHIINGRYERAQSALAEATDLARKLSVIPPQVRVWLALYRAVCGEDGSAAPDQTLSLYCDVLKLSVSATSARGAFYALNGQARAFLRLGEERYAYERFCEARDVAYSMEGTKFLVSAAIAWTSLIYTRFWREALPMVNQAQALVEANSLKAAQLKGAEGMLLGRMCKVQEALEALDVAIAVLTRLRNDRYHSNLLRERALTLHRVGETRAARASVRLAIELAEGGTDALALRQTYRAAAVILEDRQFLRLACRVDREARR